MQVGRRLTKKEPTAITIQPFNLVIPSCEFWRGICFWFSILAILVPLRGSDFGNLRGCYTSAMPLYVGTSGWSYPAWKPVFFPEKLPQKKFLEFYSTQLNTVELNVTFRRFTTAPLLQGWIASTTPDFR